METCDINTPISALLNIPGYDVVSMWLTWETGCTTEFCWGYLIINVNSEHQGNERTISKWVLGRPAVRMERRCDWHRVVFSDWLL